ncbi:MAG: lysine--tRNA ligase, partial [Egibacteraceae bacterium]
MTDHHGDELLAARREKLDRVRAEGGDPFPVGVRVDHSLAEIAATFADRLDPEEESGLTVRVAGRLVMRRGHGRLVFLV